MFSEFITAELPAWTAPAALALFAALLLGVLFA